MPIGGIKGVLVAQQCFFTLSTLRDCKTQILVIGTEENTGILPRTLNVLFDSLQERLYTKMNLKPHRSREYLRLSPDQEKEEVASKSALLRQIKEVWEYFSSSSSHFSKQRLFLPFLYKQLDNPPLPLSVPRWGVRMEKTRMLARDSCCC